MKKTQEERFKPDYTPLEMIRLGIFGGNYFGQKVMLTQKNECWVDYISKTFFHELINKDIDVLTKIEYDIEVNCYKVKSGSDYLDWIYKGWIMDCDPYGWFNWYINYYYGRRITQEDERQIQRWVNFKTRHSGILSTFPDSLKTKQNLLHWAINWEKI